VLSHNCFLCHRFCRERDSNASLDVENGDGIETIADWPNTDHVTLEFDSDIYIDVGICD
jgi:hypothetical protein